VEAHAVKTYPLLAKSLTLFLVGFLLWLPLTMIGAKINERSGLQQQVEREIENTGSGPQRIVGPLVALECVEDYVEEIIVSGPRADTIRHERKSRPCPTRYVFPETLAVSGEVPTEVRSRGIHAVRVYQSTLAFRGRLRLPREPEQAANTTRRWTNAAFIVAVGDLRGLKNTPTLLLDGHSMAFQPGAGVVDLAQAIHVPLALQSLERESEHSFSFSMQLNGTSRLAFAPLATSFSLALQSPWPHPSFDGAFLPDTRSVSRDGFTASWSVNQFAGGGAGAWSEALRNGKLDASRFLGVSLIQPVNVYAQTYRAAEYGTVLIGLTFALFLLFEVIKRWRIHAVQYALVGLALAVFFLLLLALAEHVGFAVAYAVAAPACVALLAFYIGHVVGSLQRGIAFGGYFAVLYGTMYVMLSSEDSALLLGSVLAFTALASVMIATRRLDWFALSESLKGAAGAR
jgi:inner membrane protein